MTNKPPLDELPLERCPFCGRADVERITDEHEFLSHGISCVCGGSQEAVYSTPEAAAQAWNTRATNSQEADKDVVRQIERIIMDDFKVDFHDTDYGKGYSCNVSDVALKIAAIAAQQPQRDDNIALRPLIIKYLETIQAFANNGELPFKIAFDEAEQELLQALQQQGAK